jgi:predicted DCC family thiol-disulfide oxidoreductase YuxK
VIASARAIAGWNTFWFAPGAASTLGTCRLLFFGGLFLWQLPHDFSAWGAYSTALWMPIWLFDTLGVPAFSPSILQGMQAVWKIALLLSAIGLFARPAMVLSFVLGTYLMGLPHNFGQTQHFDTLVVFASGALAMSRAADACSLDALLAAAARRDSQPPADNAEYTWPIRLVWTMLALIFFAAGVAKLRESGLEWIFSDNLSLLLLRQQYHLSDGEPLTRWGIWVANHQWASRGLAAMSVGVETTFPLALFSRRARFVLVPAGFCFLLGIRLLMGPTFEQFMMCYVFWVPWSRLAARLRERTAIRAERLVLYDRNCVACSRMAVVLARLDCLRRLTFADVNARPPGLSAAFPALNSRDRPTNTHVIVSALREPRRTRTSLQSGFDAYRSVAWLLPLAWPVLPLLYLPGVPWLGRRASRHLTAHRTATCASPM